MRLGFELAERAFPRANKDKADMADAPRRLFVVTLQMAMVVLVGIPVVAITQPFLPRLQGAVVLLLLLTLLAVRLWRQATNFQGHTPRRGPGAGRGPGARNATLPGRRG